MCRRAYPTPDTCTTLSLELLQVPASVRRDLRSRMLSVRVQDRRDDDDEARAATSLMRSSFDDGDAMLLSDMENLVYARVVVERQVNRSMSGSASSSYVIVTIPLAPRAAQDASSLDANGSNLAQRDDRRHFVQIASRYFPTPRLWLGTRASTQTGSGEVNAPLMESSRDLGTAQSVDSVSLFHDTGAAEAATDVVSDVDARTSEQRGRGIPRVELEVPHRLLGIVSRLFSDNETHRVLCCHVEVLIDVGSSPLAEMPSVDRFISIMKFDFRPDVEDGRTNISYGAHLTAAQQTRFSVVPSLVEENYDRVEINHNVMGWGSSTRLALTRHRATERVEQNLVAMTISVDPHIVRMVRLFSSVFLETGSSV